MDEKYVLVWLGLQDFLNVFTLELWLIIIIILKNWMHINTL